MRGDQEETWDPSMNKRKGDDIITNTRQTKKTKQEYRCGFCHEYGHSKNRCPKFFSQGQGTVKDSDQSRAEHFYSIYHVSAIPPEILTEFSSELKVPPAPDLIPCSKLPQTQPQPQLPLWIKEANEIHTPSLLRHPTTQVPKNGLRRARVGCSIGSISDQLNACDLNSNISSGDESFPDDHAHYESITSTHLRTYLEIKFGYDYVSLFSMKDKYKKSMRLAVFTGRQQIRRQSAAYDSSLDIKTLLDIQIPGDTTDTSLPTPTPVVQAANVTEIDNHQPDNIEIALSSFHQKTDLAQTEVQQLITNSSSKQITNSSLVAENSNPFFLLNLVQMIPSFSETTMASMPEFGSLTLPLSQLSNMVDINLSQLSDTVPISSTQQTFCDSNNNTDSPVPRNLSADFSPPSIGLSSNLMCNSQILTCTQPSNHSPACNSVTEKENSQAPVAPPVVEFVSILHCCILYSCCVEGLFLSVLNQSN